MSISLKCPGCQKSFKVKSEHAGRTMRCPACQTSLKVPDDDDADEELEAAAEVGRASASKAPQRKRKRSQGGSADYFKFWPLALAAVPFLIGLVHPMSGAGLAVLTFVAGLGFLLYGFFVGVGVTAVSNPGRTARSVFSGFHAQLTMTDAERQQLRKVSSPYLSLIGRGVMLMLIGGLATKVCFDWHTAALAQRGPGQMPQQAGILGQQDQQAMQPLQPDHQRRLQQRGFAADPGAGPTVATAVPGPEPDSGSTGESAGKQDDVAASPPTAAPAAPSSSTALPGLPPRPATQPGSRERRAYQGGNDRPRVGTIVVSQIDGHWQPVWVKQLSSGDDVVVQKVVQADGKTRIDPTPLTLRVQDLRVPFPEDLPNLPGPPR